MPLYEYQCESCAKRFERIQKYSDPPVETCPSCGEHVKKLASSPAIQFKGSGWYITDYAKKSQGDIDKSRADSGKSPTDGGKSPSEGGTSQSAGDSTKSESSSSSKDSGSPSTSTNTSSTSDTASKDKKD